MTNPAWLPQFQAELARAADARQGGNEGMARVCARRAAGLVARAYLQQHNLPTLGPSAYDHLRALHAGAGLPAEVEAVVGHFLERITTDHTLATQADLITEARWLAHTLLGVHPEEPHDQNANL